jgi:pectin methylesterase-like acyl-CoA thioesterase
MTSSRAQIVLHVIVVLLSLGTLVRAQDKVAGEREPIVATIDPSKLAYDYLVDGNLAQDDPAGKKFKTLQPAYAAAPEGTEAKPTVIGIKPNVYLIPGSMERAPSLSITKNWITLLGLTNNRRSVSYTCLSPAACSATVWVILGFRILRFLVGSPGYS